MEEYFYADFNVEAVSQKMIEWVSKWKIHLLNINGFRWEMIDHDDNICHVFVFNINFYDLEARIKLEDLKLNLIHYIESLRDDTSYCDNLIDNIQDSIIIEPNSY